MFNLDEAWLGYNQKDESCQYDESAVNWELIRIYSEYLHEKGLTLQCEAMEYLLENELRPRSGFLPYSNTDGIEHWWYVRRQRDSERQAMNRIPAWLATHLTGRKFEELDGFVIVYPTFTAAIQDLGQAWERWKLSSRKPPRDRASP